MSLFSSITKPEATGTGGIALLVGSVPLHQFNEILQTISMVLGGALTIVTLIHMANGRDSKTILARLDEGEAHFKKIDKRLSKIERNLGVE